MSGGRRLTLVRVGEGVAPEAMEMLARRLAEHLDLRVVIEAGTLLPDVANPEREDGRSLGPRNTAEQASTDLQQLSSNAVVDALADHFQDEDFGWVLGITAHDLTAPGRSYVFGEATVGGRWAIVSLARLGPPYTASPRLLERACKEALHELGHLAGLDHCEGRIGCVMKVADSVAAIDTRNSEFCPQCVRRIHPETG